MRRSRRWGRNAFSRRRSRRHAALHARRGAPRPGKYSAAASPPLSQPVTATSAGYSGTPLAKKLGIVEGMSIVTIGAPRNYAALVAPLPSGARITTRIPKNPTLVHVFCVRRADLAKHLGKLRKR